MHQPTYMHISIKGCVRIDQGEILLIEISQITLFQCDVDQRKVAGFDVVQVTGRDTCVGIFHRVRNHVVDVLGELGAGSRRHAPRNLTCQRYGGNLELGRIKSVRRLIRCQHIGNALNVRSEL